MFPRIVVVRRLKVVGSPGDDRNIQADGGWNERNKQAYGGGSLPVNSLK